MLFRRLVFSLLVATLWAIMSYSAAMAQHDERILRYHSEIELHPDTSMTVTETITVRALGLEIKRGIFRDFPTRYSNPGGKPYHVGFQLLEVTRDGEPEPHHLAAVANGVRIYAGKSDVYLPPGEYTYTIKYTTNRQLGFFDKYDELYWNITGIEWAFPIDSASATITLPVSLAKDRWRLEAFTGQWGWQGNDCKAEVIDTNKAYFVTTRPLGNYEGLTVVAMFPKGVIQPPTAAALRRFWIASHRPEIAGMVGLVFLLAYFVIAWLLVGVDPPRGFVSLAQEPPKGLSAAALRYIRMMGPDDRGYSTALISLAVKGHLVLDVDGEDTFSAVKTDGDESNLCPDEKALLDRLFQSVDLVIITQDNHPTLGSARDVMNRELARQCRRIYFYLNRPPAIIGWLISLVVLVLMIAFAGGVDFYLQRLWAILLAVSLIIVNIIFWYLLPQYTKLGRKVLDHIEGFMIALSYRHSGGMLEQEGIDPQERFESYLPYAIALDRETSWSARFERMLRQRGDDPDAFQPFWYQAPHMDRTSYTDISSTLASTFTHTITTASSPPSSSSGGGGGGFSGGGGGGGGGGGW